VAVKPSAHRLLPRRDAMLVAYCIVAATGLALGLATGRAGPVVVAAPFVACLLIGLRDAHPTSIDIDVRAERTTVLEGDPCELVIHIERPPTMRLLVHLERRANVGAEGPAALTWDVPPGDGTVELPVCLTPSDWGQYRLGALRVEGRVPGGLVRWQSAADVLPVFRVLPHPVRLQQLLEPPTALVAAGQHRSKLVGEGTDFAEVRPFVAGDRVRNLNWRATARFGTPHVNHHHPERAGQVVLVVDTFGDKYGELSMVGRAAITRCARAAWAVSRVHLAAQDRVGFLTHGRVESWLPPESGDRARYRLLDQVLTLGAAVNESAHVADTSRRTIPADALVVVFTPLWDRRITDHLQMLRRRTSKVAVIVIDTTDLFDAPPHLEPDTSARLWSLILADRRRHVRSLGMPEVLWRPDQDFGPAVARLRTLVRPHVGRDARVATR
jgi:uncharacterized protein (DUF58 family)